MTLPPLAKDLLRAARRPDEVLAQYQAFIDLAGATDTWRVVDVRPPVCVADGEVVDADSAFGVSTPPHVRLGRALQNVMALVEHQDSLFDPVSGTFFEVRARLDTVRVGRSKTPRDLLGDVYPLVERGLVACTRSYQNFYHWMVETMPRTMRLNAAHPGETLLTHPAKWAFHRALHDFAGLDLSTVELEGVIFLPLAITTTVSTNFAGNPHVSRHALAADDVLRFPRAVAGGLAGPPRRVFISRRDAATRVLNDEAALIRELEARGFDCPVMSDFGLHEQAALCANAEIIVSTHGAGLSNALFRADRPCRVVEIVPLRRWPHNNLVCFYNVSQVAGFEHHLYDCAYPNEEARLLDQNWSIDHRAFLRYVDTLID